MELAGILKRLIEIGEALNAKDEVLYPEDIYKIRQMVIEAQDFILRAAKESIEQHQTLS